MSGETLATRIDWNNDGDYTDTGEDVTTRTLRRPSLTIQRGKDQIRTVSPPAAAVCTFALDNDSMDYSRENASSPLAGNLEPGRGVSIQSTLSPTTYDLFKGVLYDLPNRPARSEKSVIVQALGRLSQLRGKRISTQLYTDITTDVAIGYILDAVGGFVAGDRVLDTGKTTLSYWWLNAEDAFDAIVDLINTEGPGAALYEDGQGRIVFESRHYRMLTARCTESQVIFRDSGIEPLHSPNFVYQSGIRDIINEASITIKKRSTGSLGVVWSLGESFVLAPNESRSFTIYLTGDPVTEAVCVAGTDFTGSPDTDEIEITLDRTSGTVITITLANSNPRMGVPNWLYPITISDLQLRARTVSVTNTVIIKNTLDTSTSQSKYGLRPYRFSVRSEITINDAQDLTNGIVGWYQNPRPIVEITVNNANDTRTVDMLSREISDRVTIVDAQTGVNDDFFIEKIKHIIAGNDDHKVIFGCELATSVQYFILDTSTLNGSDVLGF